jgi:cytochrome c oxidase subunit 2
MRGVIVVESQAEFNVWLAKQSTQYEVAHAPATPPAPTGPATQNADSAKAPVDTANKTVALNKK